MHQADEDDGTERPGLIGMSGAVWEEGGDTLTDSEWTRSLTLSNSAWVIEPSLTRRTYSPRSIKADRLGPALGPVSVVAAAGGVDRVVDAICRRPSSIPATMRGECSVLASAAYRNRRPRTSSRSVATCGSAYGSIPNLAPNEATTFCKNQGKRKSFDKSLHYQSAGLYIYSSINCTVRKFIL